MIGNKSYYKLLHPSTWSSFTWKSLWKPKVPTTVAVFLWTATLGKILTVNNLRRPILVIDWYWICKSTGETINHLLLNCPIKDFWVFFFVLFGILWVMPKGVEELLVSWQGRFGRSSNSVIWNKIPLCIMWCLWC